MKQIYNHSVVVIPDSQENSETTGGTNSPQSVTDTLFTHPLFIIHLVVDTHYWSSSHTMLVDNYNTAINIICLQAHLQHARSTWGTRQVAKRVHTTLYTILYETNATNWTLQSGNTDIGERSTWLVPAEYSNVATLTTNLQSMLSAGQTCTNSMAFYVAF